MTAVNDPAHEFASIDDLAPLALMDGIRVRAVNGERILAAVRSRLCSYRRQARPSLPSCAHLDAADMMAPDVREHCDVVVNIGTAMSSSARI
jgi:hypothetical protein